MKGNICVSSWARQKDDDEEEEDVMVVVAVEHKIKM